MGALLGGFLTGVITKRDMTTGINVQTIIVSTLGAVVALVVWNAFF